MALSLSVGCRNALINAQGFTSLFNTGTLYVYSGTSPGVELGAIGSELVNMSLNISSAGSGNIRIGISGIVSQTGTAGYFRISGINDTPTQNAAGTAIRADGTCGVISGSCDLVFSDLELTAGKLVSISGFLNIPIS